MAFAIGYYILSFVVSLISPFWGLVGFTCSLLLRFQDLYPEINMIKPFSLLLVGMVLSCIINKDKLSKLEWKQDKLILAILGLSILGLVIMSPGSLVFETYNFICSIFLYYFVSRILQTPTQFIQLFFCMALSVTYLAYLAIGDIAQFPDTSLYIEHGSKRWQGIGYYANSNEYGQLMITTIPFLLGVILLRKSLILSLISMALMGVMLFVMVKSGSRTVMITVGLMFVGTIMLRGKGNIAKKAIVGATMSILLLTVLTFMPGPIQERMGTVLDAGNDESFQGRTRSWDHGFDMLSWYPITGVGKGQWIEYHGLMPHNSYVQVMAEMGIIGIWVFLWVIWRCLLQFKPIFKKPAALPNGPPSQEGERENHLFAKEDHLIEVYVNEPITHINSFEEDFDNEGSHAAENSFEETTLTNEGRTVAIAVLVTFCGWLLYIFLGNQGYSTWTYFYLGLCTALANFMPIEESEKDEQNDLFYET